VLRRIPSHLGDEYDVEVLVIDDASHDKTFEVGERVKREIVKPRPSLEFLLQTAQHESKKRADAAEAIRKPMEKFLLGG
jgi:hypothetical protein